MAATTHTVQTLYHIPWYSSSIPYQVLLELQVPDTSVAVNNITSEQLKADPQLPVYSPRRVVPFMVLPDGSSIVESGALVLHLLETFDTTNKLYPPPGHPNRPRFLQGLFFAVAEAYKTVIAVFELCMNIKKEDRDQEKLLPAKNKFVDDVIGHLLRELDNGKNDYYLGNDFSAADIAIGYMLMTAEYCGEGLTDNEVIKAYHMRLKSRPSYTKLYA